MQLPKQHLNTALAQPRSRSGQSGFSLIEVMVSMTIFLIATGAMYGLMDIASKSRTTTSQRAELLKSARTAMLVIGRDAFNAGYKYPVYSVLVSDNKVGSLLNVAPDADGTRDTLPAIVAGRLRNANTLSNHSTDQVSFVFQDGNFNLDADIVSQALPVNAPTLNMSLGLDEVVPISGDVTACRAKDIMIITGRTSTTIGVVTGIVGSSVQFANGDVLGINTPLAIDNPMHNIQAPTSMRRVNLITYLVLPNGTLVRREYANDAAATTAAPAHDEPLVYGVEDMQITYVLENGQVTVDPVAGPDNIAGTPDDVPGNQSQVRQVRVSLTVRGTQRDASGAPFKITLSATFATRNLGYAAA